MAQLTATAEDAELPRDTPKACNSDRVVNTLMAPPKKYCTNSTEINKVKKHRVTRTGTIPSSAADRTVIEDRIEKSQKGYIKTKDSAIQKSRLQDKVTADQQEVCMTSPNTNR